MNTIPLPPPAPDKGVQFAMPPHAIAAEKERELCFAVYEDFRNVIPAAVSGRDSVTTSKPKAGNYARMPLPTIIFFTWLPCRC